MTFHTIKFQKWVVPKQGAEMSDAWYFAPALKVWAVNGTHVGGWGRRGCVAFFGTSHIVHEPTMEALLMEKITELYNFVIFKLFLLGAAADFLNGIERKVKFSFSTKKAFDFVQWLISRSNKNVTRIIIWCIIVIIESQSWSSSVNQIFEPDNIALNVINAGIHKIR